MKYSLKNPLSDFYEKANLIVRRILSALTIAALAACGGCDSPAELGSVEETGRAAIAPQQFALVPCKTERTAGTPPCQLLAAGGKYFLLGAPEGALNNLLETEIALLDGVLLFRLLPEHVEGLDTIRNVTWKRGRSQALLVSGPEGTGAFATGIDSAFEIPDAELFALAAPPGGYDASLMRPVEILPERNAGTLIVDTGDLIIRGFYAPSSAVVYQVEYSGLRVAIGGCDREADKEFLKELSADGYTFECGMDGRIVYFIE